MECGEVQEILDAFAAGELSPAKAEEVRGHLEGCAGCRQSHAGYTRALDALRRAGQETCGPDAAFYHGLARRLDEVDRYAGRLRVRPVRWHFVGAVGVAAAAVFILSVCLIPTFEPPTPVGGQQAPVLPGDTVNFAPDSPAAGTATLGAPDAAMWNTSARNAFVPVSTALWGRTPSNRDFRDAYIQTEVLPVLVFPRYSMRPATSSLREGAYVTIDDYRKLEDRLKLIEARLVTLEQNSGPGR